MAAQIENIDYNIIRMLQKNGRIPNTEIAKALGISEATVRNRLQNLIKEERLKIVAVINPFKLKSGMVGNLRIKAQKKMTQQVGAELQKLDELWYVAQLVGQADFDAEYYVDSQSKFGSLIDKINEIDGITSIETSLIVRYIKYAEAVTFP